MFQIGDKIFYPMHGAGTVTSIEEKEILGEKQVYYVLDMMLRDMQVLIPARGERSIEIREAVDSAILENVLATFFDDDTEPAVMPYKQRHRENMDKMKSGSIYEGAEVIRDLTQLSKTKKLGMEDKMMLMTARQMLISELALVKGLGQEQATNLLDESSYFN